MENPFQKKDHTPLIVGVIIGSVVVGAAAYLLLTETGAEVRKQVSGHFNRILKAVTGEKEEIADEHATDYLQKPHKRPKTDREKLLKHEILTGNEAHGEEPEQNPA